MSCPAVAQQRVSAVFGADSRVEVYQAKDPKLRDLAGSTLVIVPGSSVAEIAGRGEARIETMPFESVEDDERRGWPLCPGEKFRGEPKVELNCTAFLVEPDLIVTAGHCVEGVKACKKNKYVFGFHLDRPGQNPAAVPLGEVYGCRDLERHNLDDDGADYALIRLDRPVKNHAPLRISAGGLAAPGTPLAVIGHPMGLPAKISSWGKVRKNKEDDEFFGAYVDIFMGNSGSPVFNLNTYEVEGILVRGPAQDFVIVSQEDFLCAKAAVYSERGTKDAQVTKIARVAPYIKRRAAPLALSLRKSGGGRVGQIPVVVLDRLDAQGGLFEHRDGVDRRVPAVDIGDAGHVELEGGAPDGVAVGP